jgi:hypothetical protein
MCRDKIGYARAAAAFIQSRHRGSGDVRQTRAHGFSGGISMRLRYATVPLLLGFLTAAAPALAASTAVTSGQNGTTITSDKPCRVVTRHNGHSGSSSNSTSITSGSGGVSGSTTISPGGGNGNSVTVGSGSSTADGRTSSAAGSDCVIYRNEK